VDTLILGCTHYPLLSGMLQLEMGSDVVLVSSAEETAKDVYGSLVVSGRERSTPASPPEHLWTTTGEPGGFARLAERFLGPAVAPVRARRAELVGGEGGAR
jgi:glutamate racemase